MTYTARVAAIVRASLDPGDEHANDALDRLLAAAERRRRRARYARRSQHGQHLGLVFYRSLLGPVARCTYPDDIDVKLEEGSVPSSCVCCCTGAAEPVNDFETTSPGTY